jgi:hypothetical protein
MVPFAVKYAMYSVKTRLSDVSPNSTSFDKHSSFTERTHRSANAFRFGELAGSRNGSTLPARRIDRNRSGTSCRDRAASTVAHEEHRHRRQSDCEQPVASIPPSGAGSCRPVLRDLSRAIELLRDQLPPPAENRVRLGHLRVTVARPFRPSSFPISARVETFSIGEPQPGWRLCPENSILGGKIFDLQQQILIHQPCHVCEQWGHLIACFHPACIFSDPGCQLLSIILTLRA